MADIVVNMLPKGAIFLRWNSTQNCDEVQGRIDPGLHPKW
jgi:hypothetical protein